MSSKIQAATLNLVFDRPFYAYALFRMDRVEDCGLQHAAETDGRTLWVNPTTLEPRPGAEVEFILCHEAMHVFLLHCSPGRAGAMTDGRVSAWAADFVVNAMLKSEGMKVPKDALYLDKFAGKTWERVYSELCNDGEAREYAASIIPDPQLPPTGISPQEVVAMAAGASMAAKSRGHNPGSWVEELIGKALTPTYTWQDKLTSWATGVGEPTQSWAKLHRRLLPLGIIYPGEAADQSRLREVGVIIDSSGSVSLGEAKEAICDTMGILCELKPTKLVLLWVDAEVQDTQEFSSYEDVLAYTTALKAIPGRGGTDMTAGLRYLSNAGLDLDGVVVFTDGCTPFGSPPEYPVCWVIRGSGAKPPFGDVVYADRLC